MSPGDHLTELELSALLDGTAGPAEEQHALSCARCAASAAEWRATVGRLRAALPAPGPGGLREDSVRAAMASAGRPARPRPLWLASAAAALLLAAGLSVALVAGRSHGPRPSAATAGSAGGAAHAGVAPSYLGSFDGPAALERAVQARLAAQAPAMAPEVSGAAGASRASGGASSAGAPRSAPGGGGGAGVGATPAAADCPSLAQAAAGATGPPLLEAGASYRGAAADVFVFPGPTARTLVVERSDDCTPLLVARL